MALVFLNNKQSYVGLLRFLRHLDEAFLGSKHMDGSILGSSKLTGVFFLTRFY